MAGFPITCAQVDRCCPGAAMVGRFDFIVLLSKLLPGSVTVDMRGTGFEELLDQNQNLASVLGNNSEVKCAERLQSLLPARLDEVMDREVATVHPTTPLWEGIRLLVKRRGPLGVVEKGSGRLVGLITVQSAMRARREVGPGLKERRRRAGRLECSPSSSAGGKHSHDMT